MILRGLSLISRGPRSPAWGALRGGLGVLSLLALSAGGACRRPEAPPPPDARRPVIRSQAELAAERQARIRSGQIRPTTMPVVVEGERRVAPRPTVTPIVPGLGAIQSDMLLVNDQALTVAEVVFQLRHEIAQVRAAQTQQGFAEWARRTIRDLTRREIGAILLYQEAAANLSDQQKESLDKFVEKRLNEIVAQDYDGRTARLSGDLTRHGLSLDDFRAWIRRDVVVTQYSRERFLPQIVIRRDELVSAYQRNREAYTTPPRRELFLIEAPFAAFLPEGTTWENAAEGLRAQARLKAVRHIRAAAEALLDRPFEDVAREMSRGLNADEGGAWGFISRPLVREPYSELSRRIFDFEPGQVSEPIETAQGWYIVRCGRVEPESVVPFDQAQADLRRDLENRRFNALMNEYVLRLAGRATISAADVDAFVDAAVRRLTDATAEAPGAAPPTGALPTAPPAEVRRVADDRSP